MVRGDVVSVDAGTGCVAVRVAAAREQPFVFFPSVGEYAVYDDTVYDGLGIDDDRHRAYREALGVVAPGKVVVDIGTGRDAVWAVLAARAGARHVYAVEADPIAAGQARDVVRSRGLGPRITVVEGDARQVRLPERAEVCVSEIVGNVASAEGALAVLSDVGRRLCKPDCAWVPFRMQTWTAAVDLTRVVRPDDLAVAEESLPYLQKIFALVGRPFDVRMCWGGPVSDVVVSSAAPVESVVFDSGRPTPAAEDATAVDLTVTEPTARLTGLLLWTRVACAPAGPELDAVAAGTRAWAPVYVPLSLRGLGVRAGDRIRVEFCRTTSDDGVHPDYEISVSVHGSAGLRRLPMWVSTHHGAGFRRDELSRHLFGPN